MKVCAYDKDGKVIMEMEIPDNPVDDIELSVEAFDNNKDKWKDLAKSWSNVEEALKLALSRNPSGFVANSGRKVILKQNYGIKADDVDRVLELAPEVAKTAIDAKKLAERIKLGDEVSKELVELKKVTGQTVEFEKEKKVKTTESKAKAKKDTKDIISGIKKGRKLNENQEAELSSQLPGEANSIFRI